VITHGGHKHPRVNRYQAVYTLEQGPDGIRIVSTRLSNLQRIRTPVGSGGGWPFEDEPTSGGGLLDPVDYLMSGMYEDGLEPSPAPAGQPVDPFGIETDAR
jgi:hypothetical protein